VVQDLKAAKKPYSAPAFQILDAAAAKIELEAASASEDANARQILSVVNRELERGQIECHPPGKTRTRRAIRNRPFPLDQ